MDKDRARLVGLYDRYGALLTEKQSLYFEERYHDDLSLSEIAENEGVSKQAVRDLLVRTEKTLESLEAKLGIDGLLRELDRSLDGLAELIERRESESALGIINEMKERF